MFSIYVLTNSCFRRTPTENKERLFTKWGAAALSVDALFCGALLIIGGLSIAAALAHINQLQFLANQYPVLSYVFIAVPIGVGFVDLVLLLLKKGIARTKASPSLDVDEEITQADDFKTAQEKIKAKFDHLFSLLKEENKEQNRASFDSSVLKEWFHGKINAPGDKTYNLHQEIPKYLALYFDVDIELVKTVVLDNDNHITDEAINACLALFDILDDSEAIEQLENALKHILFVEHGMGKTDQAGIVDLDQSGIDSPVNLSSAKDIPLVNVLFLSDKCFYDIQEDSADYEYLHNQFVKENAPKSPVTTLTYTQEDLEKYIRKVRRLNLLTEEDEGVLNSKKLSQQAKEIDDTVQDNVGQSSGEVSYKTLERLVLEIVNLQNNSVTILDRYRNVLLSDPTQNIPLPGYRDKTVREYLQAKAQPNMHKFAVYLWNALAENYPLEQPTQQLRDTADDYDIILQSPSHHV